MDADCEFKRLNSVHPTPTFKQRFTKLLKPIVSFLRQLFFRLVIYLDDILIIGHSKESAEEVVNQVFHLFVSLGFVIHKEKSIMSPTQSIEYISLGTDTIAMTFSLPQKKVEKLKEIESRLE
jgi:hypothetical protein